MNNREYTFQKLMLEGAYTIQYFYAKDHRGWLGKSFEKDIYKNAGVEFQVHETFVSMSQKNALRGLHFQYRCPQTKLVCVVQGKVWDVIVDLRKNSATYGQWVAEKLSVENHKALYIPFGFAHGFIALEDDTVMLYQCQGAYDAGSDIGIRFDDAAIGIDWPVDLADVICSSRDMSLMSFEEFDRNVDFVGMNGDLLFR